MATRHLQKHFWLILCLPPCSHFPTMTDTGVSTGGRAHSPRVSRVEHGVQHVCKFLCECLDMCPTSNRPWSSEFQRECLDMCIAGNRPWSSEFQRERLDMHLSGNRPWSWECLRQEKSECSDMCSPVNRPWSWGSFNVNAWICACQTTDRDLETKKWMLRYVPMLFYLQL